MFLTTGTALDGKSLDSKWNSISIELQLSSFLHMFFCCCFFIFDLAYLWLTHVGCSSTGWAKQADSMWLKIYLLGLCLKPLHVSEFEFGRLWHLTVLACCEEVNDRGSICLDQLAHLYSKPRESHLYSGAYTSTSGFLLMAKGQEILLCPCPCSDFVRSCMWIW